MSGIEDYVRTRVREILAARGYKSVNSAAVALRLRQENLSRFLSGARGMRLSTLGEVLKALNMDAAEFFAGACGPESDELLDLRRRIRAVRAIVEE